MSFESPADRVSPRPRLCRRLWRPGAVCVLICAAFGLAGAAETGDPARQALSKGGFPWYDPARDDVKPVPLLQEPGDSAEEGGASAGDSQGKKLGSGQGEKPFPDQEGSIELREAPESEYNFKPITAIQITWSQVGIFLLAVAIAIGLFLIVRAWRRWLRRKNPTGLKKKDQPVRAGFLPDVVAKEVGDGDFLQAAEQAAARGDYRRAIVYLYAYQLTELDRRGLIRLTKGKTNRQYLRELKVRPSLARILEHTIVTFEEAYFGGRTLSAERFGACYRELPDFVRCLGETAA